METFYITKVSTVSFNGFLRIGLAFLGYFLEVFCQKNFNRLNSSVLEVMNSVEGSTTYSSFFV